MYCLKLDAEYYLRSSDSLKEGGLAIVQLGVAVNVPLLVFSLSTHVPLDMFLPGLGLDPF